MTISEFITDQQLAEIKAAVERAEKQTSGEIRVHIDRICKGNPLDRAAYIFEKLEMHKTELRNAVLFYIASRDKKFAILGDAGIHAVVKQEFWDYIAEKMRSLFQEDRFTESLILGIEAAGERLKEFFPYQEGLDINELPDDVSIGDQ